jgi:hypothetical protein
MTGRIWPACGLVLLALGCFHEDGRPLLVSANPFGTPAPPKLPTHLTNAPATEETAKRVATIGRKVLDANPQIALRATFRTIGAPQPEVFHRGYGPLRGCEVFVTEGLVRSCKTDGQLAAVLCMELGRVVSEREALASPKMRLQDRAPPASVPVGNDSGGTFGSPDGTRYVELAKEDRYRRRPGVPPPPPPEPDVLARGYLSRAGFHAGDLTDVLPLLRQAEDHSTLEQQLTGKK